MNVYAQAYGLVTPFGIGVRATLDGVRRGESRVLPVQLEQLAILAARVPIAEAARPAEALLRLAVQEAVAGIDTEDMPFYVGTCSGEMRAFERVASGQALPDDPMGDWYESPARAVARDYRLRAPLVFASACTSSLTALHAAAGAIRRGEIERALVAGTDATCLFAASGFATLRAAGTTPAKPFSKSRTGLSFGEGAAAMVLSKHAGEVKLALHGTGLSADAKHVTAPRADALGLEAAVRKAAVRAPDVYVAHGTGTQANDAMELTLGARLGWLGKPWLAHKGLIGHAMGASGLISMVIANEQMAHGIDSPPAYSDLEEGVVLGGPLRGARTAVVAAAAFGGANAAACWSVA